MMPGVLLEFSDEQNLEKHLEKQMGCMTGFLQLFDRHQILAGKRLYTTKRLTSSVAFSSTSPSEKSDSSPSPFSKEPRRSLRPEARPFSPENHSPSQILPKLPVPLPLPAFEFKDKLRSSWKIREAPRLSLDSRAVVDAKGKLCPRDIRTTPATYSRNQSDGSEAADEHHKQQRRSPSVVARLMGLEMLPHSGDGEPLKGAELRRSASESRASRDLPQYRFLDGSSFQQKPPHGTAISAEDVRRFRSPDFAEFRIRGSKPEPAPRTPLAPVQRKSFFDAQDFFPEPKTTESLYGEIEKRLRMRGIDEPAAKDLETLKQILEALQLKGLLHSKPLEHQINGRNLIHDHHSRSSGESPIVVMKPAPRPPRRTGGESPPLPNRSGYARRNLASESIPPVNSRRDGMQIDRNLRGGNGRSRGPRSPDLCESTRSPSSLARRRPLNAEPPRSNQPKRRTTPVQSPKSSPRKLGSDPLVSRSPRNRKAAPEISPKGRIYVLAEDDTSTISESSISSSSQIDLERSRKGEYRAGRSLLERCDKLLHSIAEITSAEQVTAVEQQPSPVSVLDPSFYCDESSPSPVLKRPIDFKDQSSEWEEEQWTQAISLFPSKGGDEPDMEEDDYVYVREILCASDRHRHSDVFEMLEKRRHQEREDSEATSLHRKLVFDTVSEILERWRQASQWDAFKKARSSSVAATERPLLRQVWVELRRNREQVPADDLNGITYGAMRKDMAGDHGWENPSGEMSDAVLHIERQIFKDLVAEIIRDLASFAGKCRAPVLLRRKLLF